MEEFLAPPSTRSRLKTRLVQTSNPKLLFAGDGSEPGPVITSEAAAAAVNELFERCESDLRFAVDKSGPSYDDLKAIQTPLEALDRDRGCSKMQFLDRQDLKWRVRYQDSDKRAYLVDEEARLESRTLCSVPSSTHIHTFTSTMLTRRPHRPRLPSKRGPSRVPRSDQ